MPSSAASRPSQTEAGKEPIVFVELNARQDAGYAVSLEWDRDTDNTQIVVADSRTACLLVFPVPGENAGDAFRHPFRYVP
jgi:carotenoid cleavage dioxygenase-like enzyme